MSIFSSGSPKSCVASISSSPLFAIVAESTVTFGPIAQFGFFSASHGRARAISSKVASRKTPPEAVRMMRSTCRRGSEPMHWKTALCSLSTGRIFTPRSRAAAMTNLPASTRISLLATATSLRERIAASVGRSPRVPTTAETTRFASGVSATSQSPSSPEKMRVPAGKAPERSASRADASSKIATRRTPYFSAMTASLRQRERAATPTRRALSRCPSSTFSVFSPIDPVAPSKTIFRIVIV